MKKAQTLQINQFLGVDQYISNTKADPRKFKELTNLDTDNFGRIKDVAGSTNIVGTCSVLTNRPILWADFLKKSNGREMLMFCTENTTGTGSISEYSSSDFASIAGAAGNTTFTIDVYYRGLGRTLAYQSISSVSIRGFTNRQDRGGVTITSPFAKTIPNEVTEILFFAHTASTTQPAAYIAGYHKQNGVWSSQAIKAPIPQFAATGVDSIVKSPSTGSIKSVSKSGGTLVPGRTYFVAVAPYLNSTLGLDRSPVPTTYASNAISIGSFQSADDIIFSVTIADGHNAISFLMDGYTDTVSVTNIRSAMVFIAETLEDFVMVGFAPVEQGGNLVNNGANGISVPATIDYSFTTGPTVVTNKNTLSGIILEVPQNNSLQITMQYMQQFHPKDNDKVWAAGTTSVREKAGVCRFTVAGFVASGYPDSQTGIAWFCVDASGSTISISDTTIKCMFPPFNAIGYRSSSKSPTCTGDPSSLDIDQSYAEPVSNYGPVSSVIDSTAPWTPLAKDVSISKNGLEYYRPSTVAFGERLFIQDGFSQLYYCDGVVLKPVVPDYQTWYAPIAKALTVHNSRLITAGGGENYTYTPGNVFYSEIDNEFSFTLTPSATPQPNTISANIGDNGDIIGLDVYSTNLAVDGLSTFLVVGKETSVLMWDGDTATGLKQMSANVGWASPNCYTLTNLGPVFVGADGNIYALLADSKVVPMGYPVFPILNSIGSNLQRVFARFHDNNIKIMYQEGTDVLYKKEIWLERRVSDQGQLVNLFKGPHNRATLTLATSVGSSFQAVYRNWNKATDATFIKNLRVGSTAVADNIVSKMYQFEAEGAVSTATKTIVIDRLGLEQDHFLKILKDIYIAAQAGSANITFSITLSGEDGNDTSYTFTGTQTYIALNKKKLNQFPVEQRYLERVYKVQIDITSTGSIELYDISLLYDIKRRRRLT